MDLMHKASDSYIVMALQLAYPVFLSELKEVVPTQTTTQGEPRQASSQCKV